MAELLVRVRDRSARPDDSKAGDVIAACPDGWVWTRRERTNPDWRIIHVDLLPKEVASLTMSRISQETGRLERKREYGIDIATLSDRPSRQELLAAISKRPPSVAPASGVQYEAVLPVVAGIKPKRSSRRSWIRGIVCVAVLLFAARKLKAATTVVHSIGTTGRDYSTLQAWEDACPANLVTADQIWQGECYNDSEFTAGVTISGVTVDATRYVVLKCASGQSFQDHSSVRSNALKYDQSKGVGIKCTTSLSYVVYANQQYTQIHGLQISTGATTDSRCAKLASNCLIKDCYMVKSGTMLNSILHLLGSDTVVNCVMQLSGGAAIQLDGSANKLLGCTLVTPSDITPGGNGYAFYGDFATNTILQSCAIFNFYALTYSGTYDTTNSKNNATNFSTGLPGSNNKHSVSWSQTTPFMDADKDSLDVRAIASTDLAGNGYLDSTLGPKDISKTSRAASPTIGAWELSSSYVARRRMTG